MSKRTVIQSKVECNPFERVAAEWRAEQFAEIRKAMANGDYAYALYLRRQIRELNDLTVEVIRYAERVGDHDYARQLRQELIAEQRELLLQVGVTSRNARRIVRRSAPPLLPQSYRPQRHARHTSSNDGDDVDAR
jgi:hypothetical protein